VDKALFLKKYIVLHKKYIILKSKTIIRLVFEKHHALGISAHLKNEAG